MAKAAAAKSVAVGKELLKQSSIVDARRESDTIRLWESYRDQATLWRALALLQIPATCIAIIFAIVLWNTRSIVLNVPAKPLPGKYAAQDIPDTEFINIATDFLNLVASYQHNVARRQFEAAAQMLSEPLLSRFVENGLGTELKTIESTNRTQVFFVDPLKTEILRDNDREITIIMMGDRLKIVAGRELPLEKTKFSITMTTIPRNKLNPYGIVITDYGFSKVEKRKHGRKQAND
ncbi:MAG: hypothetical protein KDD42_01330 [Bdellovibrionales bacterium]|nr:hypothetical protein [Bdellovibrionales bacterium]